MILSLSPSWAALRAQHEIEDLLHPLFVCDLNYFEIISARSVWLSTSNELAAEFPLSFVAKSFWTMMIQLIFDVCPWTNRDFKFSEL